MPSIYFACSIRGGRDDAERYAELVAIIKQHANLLTEIFADGKLTAMGSAGKSSDIYTQDLAWVEQSDAVIAEVSSPSLGVGYEIAKAEQWGKPVLALYRNQEGKRLSAMIDGDPNVQVVHYNDVEQAEAAIKLFIKALA
ncbi:MAG: nucleoside 2-deoxyribosyltransferase [Patescibacteria group bacterium]|nr:nucleoside 2-deoxyribosyltransferase [Patescibacteria group bacterium]